MNRRDTILGVLALGAAAPLAARAQARRRQRIGMLWVSPEPLMKPYLQAFLAGLRDHGYVAGENVDIDIRYADGHLDRLPALADELLALKPDVLTGVDEVALAMKRKTSTVPIVFPASIDPVLEGLVESLARPGGNVTGLSFLLHSMAAKHVELLADLLPKGSRFAVLNDAAIPRRAETYEAVVREVAGGRGLTPLVFRVREEKDIDQAFADLKRQKPDGIVIATTARLFAFRPRIIEHARKLRLPSVSALPGFADAGGTIFYGANFLDAYRYAAKYVDRILKGAKPAELPVEQFSRYELVINLKTAKALGLTIPRETLLRADRVIE
jgi:putative tryptophan/tyrosine transport system substrate-binding protein